MATRKVKAYTRRDGTHVDSYDRDQSVVLGITEPDEEGTDPKTEEEDHLEQEGLTARHPEDADIDEENEEDVRKALEEQQLRAYEERKRKEAQELSSSREYAASSARLKALRSHEFKDSHSRQEINWGVDAVDTANVVDDYVSASQADVIHQEEALTKLKSNREELLKEKLELEEKTRKKNASKGAPQGGTWVGPRLEEVRSKLADVDSRIKRIGRTAIPAPKPSSSFAEALSSSHKASGMIAPEQIPVIKTQKELAGLRDQRKDLREEKRKLSELKASLGAETPGAKLKRTQVDRKLAGIKQNLSDLDEQQGKLQQRLSAAKAKAIEEGAKRRAITRVHPKEARAAIQRRNYLQTAQFTLFQQGRQMDPAYEKELNDLNKRIAHWRVYEKPDEEGKVSSEREKARLKKLVESQFPVETGVPEQETAEDVIANYGQEDPNLGFSEGWGATYKFNKQQIKRKVTALKTGEASLGLGERGKPGHSMGVPVEKAKATIGPNQEWLIKTKNWTPVDPKAASNGNDKFIVKLDRVGKEAGWNLTLDESQTDKYYTEGQDLNDTLKENNLPGLEASEGENGTWVIHTKLGEHLTPDQIHHLEAVLRVNHGVKSFRSVGTIGFTRDKHIAPVGYSKLPNDIKDNDVAIRERRNLYSGVGARFGARHPISDELLEGQTDTLGVRVPGFRKDLPHVDRIYRLKDRKKISLDDYNAAQREQRAKDKDAEFESHFTGEPAPKTRAQRTVRLKSPARINLGRDRALQYHFDESTDAIGWGTSYRPGSKEISNFALALPRARRERKIQEASAAWDQGNRHPMYLLMKEEHPELETRAEREDQVKTYQQHAREIAGAATAAGYYSAKKQLPSRVAAKVYSAMPDKVQKKVWSTGATNLFKDLDYAYRPIPEKMRRAKYRVFKPLGDPDDPTSAGITFVHNKVNLPSWRYRKYLINPEDQVGRQWEKRAANLANVAKSRRQVEDFLKSDSKNIYSRVQARSALKDPEKRMSDDYLVALRQLKDNIDAELGKTHVPLAGKSIPLKDASNYSRYLLNAQAKIRKLEKEAAVNDFSHERLRNLWDEWATRTKVAEQPVKRALLKGGAYGLGAGAVAGAGILAVDRYQTYKHNKGDNVDHAFLKSVLPERIVTPQVSIKRASQFTIPHNSFTSALDLEGEKVPTSARISVSKKERLRLYNHRDISGEYYDKNLPLLGGIGLTAPAPVKGSKLSGVISDSKPASLGTTKNMYVFGHKVPVDVQVGKKERWSDKNHNLKAKYNPYSMTNKDREKLAVIALRDPSRRDQIETFYHGDDKLHSMIHDKDESERILKRNPNMYASSIEDVEGGRGVGRSDTSSQLLEDYARVKRANNQARRDQNRG